MKYLQSNILMNCILLYLFSFSFYMQYALVMYVIAARSLRKRDVINVAIYVVLAVIGVLICGVVYNGMAVIKAVIIRTA